MANTEPRKFAIMRRAETAGGQERGRYSVTYGRQGANMEGIVGTVWRELWVKLVY
jgi:hypothetical protein